MPNSKIIDTNSFKMKGSKQALRVFWNPTRKCKFYFVYPKKKHKKIAVHTGEFRFPSGLEVPLLVYLLQFLISSTWMHILGWFTFLLFSVRIDVDECMLPDAYACYGICENLPGSFHCQCPQGTYGDPKTKGGCITIKNFFPGDDSWQYTIFTIYYVLSTPSVPKCRSFWFF
jgi:hypothetical protein